MTVGYIVFSFIQTILNEIAAIVVWLANSMRLKDAIVSAIAFVCSGFSEEYFFYFVFFLAIARCKSGHRHRCLPRICLIFYFGIRNFLF